MDQVLKEDEILRTIRKKTLDTIILSPKSGSPIGLTIDDITDRDKDGRKRTYLFYLKGQSVGYCGFGSKPDPIVQHSPLYFLDFFPFEVSDSTIKKVRAASSSRHTTSLKELRRIVKGLKWGSVGVGM